MDSISNSYTLITIYELKPWIFFAFNKISLNSNPLLVQFRPPIALRTDACRASDAWREKMITRMYIFVDL